MPNNTRQDVVDFLLNTITESPTEHKNPNLGLQIEACKMLASLGFPENEEIDHDTIQFILERTIPEWNNRFWNLLKEFAIAEGYPPEVLEEITDPVFIVGLYRDYIAR